MTPTRTGADAPRGPIPTNGAIVSLSVFSGRVVVRLKSTGTTVTRRRPTPGGGRAARRDCGPGPRPARGPAQATAGDCTVRAGHRPGESPWHGHCHGPAAPLSRLKLAVPQARSAGERRVQVPVTVAPAPGGGRLPSRVKADFTSQLIR
jgi:hypothetical protein